MQFVLELLSDDSFKVEESVERVLENECGRVSDLIFEQVKGEKEKQIAIHKAEYLLPKYLAMCSSKQLCIVIQELEERILNYEDDSYELNRS